MTADDLDEFDDDIKSDEDIKHSKNGSKFGDAYKLSKGELGTIRNISEWPDHEKPRMIGYPTYPPQHKKVKVTLWQICPECGELFNSRQSGHKCSQDDKTSKD